MVWVALNDYVAVLNGVASGTDSHGNPAVDWSAPVVRVEPAMVTPLRTSEQLVGGDVVTSRWHLFLRAETAADSASRILWRGDTYEVDGEVQLHVDLLASPHHYEALLVRWSG